MILITNTTGGIITGWASRRGDAYTTTNDFGTSLFMDTFRNSNFQNRFLSMVTHEVGQLLDVGFAGTEPQPETTVLTARSFWSPGEYPAYG